MTTDDVVKRWKDPILIVFGTIGVIVTCTTYYWNNFYVNDSLEATFAGFIEGYSGQEQDRVGERFAIVNKGNRDAALLDAELLIWNDHNTNHGPGFHWDPIPVGGGDEFRPQVVRPGTAFVVSLSTLGHGQEFYSKPIYGTAVDSAHKRVVFGVKFYAMNSKGTFFKNVYPVSYMLINADYQHGPTAGFYLDRSTHSLFCDCEMGPQKIANYNSSYP